MKFSISVFEKREDRPTPPAVYNWRVYLWSFVAAFSACLAGYDSSFIGGTLSLSSFQHEFGWDRKTTAEISTLKENIVSIFQAGAVFGAILVYPLQYRYGRRISLLVCGVVFLIGAGLCCGPTGKRGLGLMYAGRVITGLAVGGTSGIAPIYISEISPPAIRGQLVGMYEISWQIGTFVGFWINYALNKTMAPTRIQWQIPFIVQIIPGSLFFIGMIFVRESPRWLLYNNQVQRGIETLCWLRHLDRSSSYLQEEIAQIESAIEEQNATIGRGYWAPYKEIVRSPVILKRLALSSSLFIWQNGTGINAIVYYSPTIFSSLGFSSTSASLLTTGVFGVIKILAALVWFFILVEKYGRRSVLIVGSIGSSLTMWYVGAYLKVSSMNEAGTVSAGGKAAVAMMYIWTVFYGASWNGTPWVVSSELFHQNIRSVTQGITGASNWFWTFIMARFTPNMLAKMTYGTYFLFASMTLISIPFVFFLLPETKGIPLEEIDFLFAKGVPAYRAHGLVMERLNKESANDSYDDKASEQLVEGPSDVEKAVLE
ncbi:quinate permease [Dipodascopsis tothii]|uniref:quinate permease n=1 Tax=Dipodascopsis tothii TaxID=44089 RepID=UPI0034CF3B9E